MKKTAVLLMVAFVIFSASPAPAADYGADRDMDVVFDILLVRPVGLAATVVGSAFLIVSLPFSIPSGSVGKTADILVAQPFKYTFNRPIGDFGLSTDPPAQTPAPEAGPAKP